MYSQLIVFTEICSTVSRPSRDYKGAGVGLASSAWVGFFFRSKSRTSNIVSVHGSKGLEKFPRVQGVLNPG
jgi:hypothetical protein